MNNKRVVISSVLLLLTLFLTSCLKLENSDNVSITLTETNNPVINNSSLKLTPTILNIPTAETIKIEALSKDPMSGSSCLYGVEPNISTLSEVRDIFDNLGSHLELTYQNEQQKYYYTSLFSDDGLYNTAVFKTEDDIVQSINGTASPDDKNLSISNEMFVYYKTIFSKFGQPNNIRLSISYGPKLPDIDFEVDYFIDIFYTDEDLIIEYYYKVEEGEKTILICPLKDKFQGVRFWLGENPDHPPFEEPELESISNLTAEQFYNIYSTESSSSSCFLVEKEKLPYWQ